MKFNSFILKMIQLNIRKYSLFLLSAIFSMTSFFVFANLWFTDSFQENINSQMHSLMVIAAAITILFSIFIISYVQWYLMKERAKSFAVLLSYGMRHKDLQKMIIMETLMIYLVSLFLACLTGSIFSKLFFMISIRLLMINNSKIVYQLTFESFLVTAVIFFIIFVIVLVIALIRISRKDLIELSKEKSNVELTKRGNIFLGLLGILILAGSMTALYLHNLRTSKDAGLWILVSAFLCLLGTYLLISHFSRLFYARLKKNSKRYYGNILEASEFAMSYRQNRKTLFILTLLTIGIILFTSVTYTLYREAYRISEIENPHDLYYEDFEAYQIMSDKEAKDLLSGPGTAVTQTQVLPFLYMKAPDMHINNWRTSNYVPVVSETAYNKCFKKQYQLKSGEAVQVIFESGLDKEFRYFGNEIRLENGDSEYTYTSPEPVYDKILNRYVFTQGVLLVVNDADYDRFDSEASPLEKGNLHMLCFADWKTSKNSVHAFTDQFYKYCEEFAGKNSQVFNELIDRYGYAHLQVRSRISYLEIQQIQGSFSLFIMGFVSILFAFCILITYSFKVFMNVSEDAERFKKLEGIGIKLKEKRKLIKTRIRLLIFVPAFLGIIIGIAWCCAVNFKKILEIDLSDMIILRNALVTGGGFFIIVYVFYLALQNSYLNRLKL